MAGNRLTVYVVNHFSTKRHATMNPTTFLPILAQELQLLGISFGTADLAKWIEAAWPLIEEDADVMRWAREYGAVAARA